MRFTYKGENIELKLCNSITKEQYDNIKDYIKEKIKENGKGGAKCRKFSIDCNSNYLVFSLLSLILLLI